MLDTAEHTIWRVVREVRRHLGLDVAFVSQVDEQRRVFRYVDTELVVGPVRVGDADPREESYCHYVLSGEIPSLLHEPAKHPVTGRLSATWQLPVGTHVGVPIVLSDGTVYGTFCCFSQETVESAGEQHVALMRLVAEILGDCLEVVEVGHREREGRRRRLEGLTAGTSLVGVMQPIVSLQSGVVVGREALTRFPTLSEGPSSVFAQAWDVGLGVELEITAAEAALQWMDALPSGEFLAVNAAPATLASDRFLSAVRAASPERLVVEVTEPAAVSDYEELRAAVAGLADLGVRLAIDDVGSGFSGLIQIVQLNPQILKIDRSLVAGVGRYEAHQAMVSALGAFAARMNVEIVAEGIETEEDLTALRVLGVDYGQGFYLARPSSLDDAVAWAAPAGSDVAVANE